MRQFLILPLALLASLHAQTVSQGGPPAPVREPQPCQVTRIVDGDTIECAPFGRVRLIGMDTPEAGQQPFGEMATEALNQLLAVGSEVALEPDVDARDRYGRVLGYVWADGVMVNWALVRQGYAVLLTYPPNVQYVDWLTAAQTAAREERLGLWAIDGFACLPIEYRRGRCRWTLEYLHHLIESESVSRSYFNRAVCALRSF